MSTAWAGGTDAILERMEEMTSIFIEEQRKSMYVGESTKFCEECGDEFPEKRRKAIPCRYCLGCQTKLEKRNKWILIAHSLFYFFR